MNNWLKRNKKKIIIGVGLLLTPVILILGLALTTKPSASTSKFTDSINDYDDKEFYYMTHNDDGSLNEYGQSLM